MPIPTIRREQPDGFSRRVYSTLVMRTPVFMATILLGALVFDVAYGSVCDRVFDRINRGVGILKCTCSALFSG